MYKSTSRSDQRGSRLNMADMVTGDFEDLPPEQQRENLVSQYKKLTEECALLPKGERRRELGLMISKVGAQISAIRPKTKGPQDLAQYFVEVCRTEFTRAQFNRVVAEATKRKEKAEHG